MNCLKYMYTHIRLIELLVLCLYPFDDFEYYMDNKVGIKKRPGNWNSNFFFKFNVLNNQYIIENTECETTVTFMFRM